MDNSSAPPGLDELLAGYSTESRNRQATARTGATEMFNTGYTRGYDNHDSAEPQDKDMSSQTANGALQEDTHSTSATKSTTAGDPPHLDVPEHMQRMNEILADDNTCLYRTDTLPGYDTVDSELSASIADFATFGLSSAPQKPAKCSSTVHKQPRMEIGIAQILKQKCRITVDQGITYNVLVVGRSGSGKTSLVNALFGTDLLSHGANNRTTERSARKLQMSKFVVSNNDMRLNFSLVETSSYGNALDNSFAWVPITNYIDEQMKLRVFQEEQPHRGEMSDGRVHLCLYLLEPVGSCDGSDCISQLDLYSMKELGRKCNLLPVISKSDMLTNEEIVRYKGCIQQVCELHEIEICKFVCEFPLGEDHHGSLVAHVKQAYPLAVMSGGPETEYRSRRYPWATIDGHLESEFLQLQDLVLSRGLVPFIKSTDSAYESIRSAVLTTRVLKVKEYIEASNASHNIMYGKDGTELRARLCDFYALFNKSLMDQVLAEWSSEYLSKQQAFMARYNRLVSLEEDKFRAWSQRLVAKQKRSNADIQALYGELQALQQRCQELEYHVVTGRAAPAEPEP
mgnify:CR=1 FL=1